MIWDREEMKKQFESLPQEQRELLQRSADRVRIFAESQRLCITDLSTPIKGTEIRGSFNRNDVMEDVATVKVDRVDRSG